ncbi:MAG: lipopolysaccharide biosynthesis protein [Hyphomicrobiales bacterium]|nr:lipopolysaccharide biosynthesis protein [Hyphomicrobiales bacterium]
MLYRDLPQDEPGMDGQDALRGRSRSALDLAIEAIRRRFKALIAWVVFCLVLCAAYIVVTPAEYAATSLIILEPRRPAFLTQSDVNQVQQNLDTPQIESQTQIIKSGRVLNGVIKEMDLAADPDLTAPRRGIIAMIKDILVDEVEKPPSLPVETFAERINVRRMGQSLVLEISVRASTPEQSARLTNAVVAAYLYDQVSSKLIEMRRTGDWLQSRIEDMRNQQQAALTAMRTGVAPDAAFPAADVRVLNTATPPTGKSFPKTTLLMIFAMSFALVTGIAAVVVGRLLDRRVWTEDDMVERIATRCLGSIPYVRGMKMRYSGKRPAALELATLKPLSKFAESFRTIRNVVLNHSQSAPRTIGVLSSTTGEGATMIAANLAHTLAASGASVVLIDADLKSAELTRLLAQGSKVGLSELAQQAVTAPPELVEIGSSLKFLPALPHGKKAQPFLFFGSQTMRRLLEEFSRSSIVIVDLPSLSESNDAIALAPLLEGLIVVVESGSTSVDEVAQAIDQLEHAKATVIGTVINKERQKAAI